MALRYTHWRHCNQLAQLVDWDKRDYNIMGLRVNPGGAYMETKGLCTHRPYSLYKRQY